MKRTILSLLVAGLFAGVGASAIAQNVTAGDHPNANEQVRLAPESDSTAQKPGMTSEQTDPAKAHAAAKAAAKADYDSAKEKAQTQYKEAKVKCDTLQGDAKSSCVTQATTARNEALAQAKKQWETQGKMNKTEGDATNPSGKDNAANTGAKPAKDEVSVASDQPQYPK